MLPELGGQQIDDGQPRTSLRHQWVKARGQVNHPYP